MRRGFIVGVLPEIQNRYWRLGELLKAMLEREYPQRAWSIDQPLQGNGCDVYDESQVNCIRVSLLNKMRLEVSIERERGYVADYQAIIDITRKYEHHTYEAELLSTTKTLLETGLALLTASEDLQRLED